MKKSLFLTLMLSLALSHPLVAEEVTVGTGTSTSRYPFSSDYKYSTTETIYNASELGGSGTITSISYNYSSSSNALDSEVKIYMGHKSEDSFSSGTDYIPASALTLVYDHSVTLGNRSGWEKFNLDKQFEYKGDQNLLVVICKSATNTKSLYYYTTSDYSGISICRTSSNSSLYADVEETEGFSTSYYYPNAKFEFLSETVEKDGATYLLRTNTGCATLTDGQNCSGNLIIPNVITDAKGASYKVTEIKAEAFKNNPKITSVSIPEHVASIANSTFYGCTGLTSINIPNSVTGIGTSAFCGCI